MIDLHTLLLEEIGQRLRDSAEPPCCDCEANHALYQQVCEHNCEPTDDMRCSVCFKAYRVVWL